MKSVKTQFSGQRCHRGAPQISNPVSSRTRAFAFLVCALQLQYAVAATTPTDDAIGRSAASQLQAERDQMRDLKAQLIELRSQVDALRQQSESTQKLLSDVSAHLYAQNTASQPKENIDARITALSSQQTEIVKSVDGLDTSLISPDLKSDIKKCVSAAIAAAQTVRSNPSNGVAPIVSSCPKVDRDKIDAELNAERQAAEKKWQDCRNVVLKAGATDSSSLPADPADYPNSYDNGVLSSLRRLNSAKGDVAGCASTLENAYKQIREQDNAAAALGSAMELAGEVCMASGGNPYVCGGMLVFAFLMDLFKGGGGGNGGSGNGTGTASDSGSGFGPGTMRSGVPGPDAVAQNTIPGPGGPVACNPAGGGLECHYPAHPEGKFEASPASAVIQYAPANAALTDFLGHQDSQRLTICDDASHTKITALIIESQGQFFFFKASDAQPGSAVFPSTPASTKPNCP